MTVKRLSLRRSDICSVCGAELSSGTIAWWDGDVRSVTYETCHLGLDAGAVSNNEVPLPPALEVEIGVAGRSALEEFQKRHDAREARIDAKFGRLAGVVKFLTDDPQSITAWKKGSIGEQTLAASLEQSLGDRVIVLNDRKAPRTKGPRATLTVWS